MTESLAFRPQDIEPRPVEVSTINNEVIDMVLVKELLNHHQEDYQGMLDEEKLAFLGEVKTHLNDSNEAVKMAAKLFLEEVKGGKYEN